MFRNAWIEEIESLRARNQELKDALQRHGRRSAKNRKRVILEFLFMFLGLPIYAISLWIVLEYFTP